MARIGRGVRYTLIGLAVFVVLAIAAVLLLTRTDFGVDRAGRFALDQIRGSINGELEVGRIESRGLLRGVTLHDVSLIDRDGRPFLVADSARLAYRLRTLLGGDIAFDRLFLYSPEVTIERLPGQDEWNYDRLFPGDTTAPDTLPDQDLVLIEDATVHDGVVIVRSPWEPDGPVEPDDTARMILEETPTGLVWTWRFEEVNARVPRIVWEAPGEEGKTIRVSALSTRAYVWETPAEIREAEGTVVIRDSLVSFELPHVRLPASELSLVGRIILDEDNLYDIEAEGDDVAFADLRWLYPRMPRDGGGSLRFRIQTQESGDMLWLARDARVRSGGSEIAGSFGIVTGDTLFFTHVDLEASPLDLELLRSVLPVDLPVEGLLIGTVEVEGPISALRTRGDVRHLADGGDTRARWNGTVRARRPYAVRGLEADVSGLDLEALARVVPKLRLRGTASGTVRADGSLERGLDVRGRARLDQGDRRTEVAGEGRFAIGGDRSAFDLRFDAEPLPLELLGEQIPALAGLVGEARGPVTVEGTLDELRVDVAVETPAGGVRLDGLFALGGTEPRYRAQGEVTDYQLDRVLPQLPDTRVTARFDFDGSGRDLETLNGRLAVEVSTATVEGVEVHRGVAAGTIADGSIRVDTLSVQSEIGDARAVGTFGLIDSRSGQLRVAVRADSLAALERVMFPVYVADDFSARPESRLAGSVAMDAVFEGSVGAWAVSGAGSARDAVYDRVRADSAAVDLRYDARTRALALEATVDSLWLGSRLLSHGRATVRHDGTVGDIVILAGGVGVQTLEADAGFRIRSGRGRVAVELGGLSVTTRDGRWTLADTAAFEVGRGGLDVDRLLLRRDGGRSTIRVAGVLPWRSRGTTEVGEPMATLAVEVDSVSIGEMLRVSQADTTMDGVVTGRFRVAGTALAPTLDGELVSRPFRYGGAALDSVAGTVGYRDRQLTGAFRGWRGTEDIISAEATVPVELALADRDERLLDAPMSMRFRADSVPAGLVAFLVPGLRRVEGIVDGDVLVVGTPIAPEMRGEVRLSDGTAVFEPSGVRYREMTAVASMGTGSLIQVDSGLRTANGRAEVRGTIDLARPRDPVFDLDVYARSLDAARRRDVVAVADGEIHLGGRYTRPELSGSLRVIEGEMNLDEIWRQYQIVQLDPSLFRLFDTTTVSYRPEPDSPFLKNLVVRNASIEIDRDVWLRSRELNVEVTGALDVNVDRSIDDLRLVGVLEAHRGTYQLQVIESVPARRFDIRRGTIAFVGTPGIDPDLDITASYRVRRQQGDPIDVLAVVDGTLLDPRVQLTSESDLPISDSDLASYLLFGRAGNELTQAEADLASRLGESGWGLIRPALTTGASTILQSVATSLGLPVDYLALSTPERYLTDIANPGLGVGERLLADAQLEVGVYVHRNWFVVGSFPFGPRMNAAPGNAGLVPDRWGARVEWRFLPTWLMEVYLEDRYARTPSFGLGEVANRKVQGISLVREWGY